MTTMKTKLKVKNQSLLRSKWSSHEDGAHRMECAGSYRMVEHDGGYRMKPLIVWNFSWLAGLRLLIKKRLRKLQQSFFGLQAIKS